MITTINTSREDEAQFPIVGFCNLPYSPTAEGLLSKGALDLGNRVEEALLDLFDPQDVLHLGHVTGGGLFQIFFAFRRSQETTYPIKLGFFKRKVVEIVYDQASGWDRVRESLAPNPIEYEEAISQHLTLVLSSHGDDHQKIRQVDFGFVFHDPYHDGREPFLKEAAERFPLAKIRSWDDDYDDFWCEIAIETAVDLATIAPLCAELRELARRHGGDLDGWACPVTP
ncbi:MAG: ribonuclease E inhibitor RraB [Fimbriimonadaceae bacterium]|nr:ribonuclease E inhibitor RraB [Fimbriimonadaceae bacterium]